MTAPRTRAATASAGRSGRPGSPAGPVLEIEDLRVEYRTAAGARPAVRGVSLALRPGEVLALVGESGSGKSTLAHTVNGMLPAGGRITSGAVRVGGRDVAGLGRRGLRALRGAQVGVVPQDPGSSLNPTMRIGAQIAEVLRIHRLADRRAAAAEAVRLLDEVGIDRPELRARQFPHELSGGMRQRVLIAVAMAARPALLIADEPTSALDATVSRRVLDRLAELTAGHAIALLLITHDLAMAAERADRIAVLRDGLLVEEGGARQVVTAPRHAYTRLLLADTPSLRPRPDGPAGGALPDRAVREAPVVLEARGLTRSFRSGRGAEPVRAVDGVDLTVRRGRTLGILGESGSGKSTTARMLLGLERPDRGRVLLGGTDVAGLGAAGLRQARRRVQLVQQNPYTSLDPRFTVRRTVAEPLRAHRIGGEEERAERVRELLAAVALPPDAADRLPRELSGGQRQRVAIARALVLRPELVVCDEPVSALDVTVQAQILDLLRRLQDELGVSYVFISHDLAVVRQICDEVLVMRQGRVIEAGPTERVFGDPAEEYTRSLLAAVPEPFAPGVPGVPAGNAAADGGRAVVR